MYDRVVHRRGLAATGALAAAVLILTAACGSSKFRYVSDSDTDAYLKVPKGWTEYEGGTLLQAQAAASGGVDLVNPLDKASLLGEKLMDLGALRRKVEWRLAFDSARQPSLQHVVYGQNDAPVVEVLVRDITQPPELRELVNAALMEDIFERQMGMAKGLSQSQLEAVASDQATMPDVEVKVRDVAFEDGARRMRLIAGFRGRDDEVYALDQTSVIDADTQRLYLLVIRARESQYIAHFDVLNEIATSFTVKQNG